MVSDPGTNDAVVRGMNSRLAPASSLERLHPESRLWGARGACLPQRFPDVTCKACENECPVGALSISVDGFRLSRLCHGCGRCTAVCPTHALSIGDDGFEVPDTIDAALSLECEKVPAALTDPGALRVRCTGALPVSRLLAFADKAAGHGLQIVDHGWCSECEAGGGDAHPAAARIEAANTLLNEMGVPHDDCIRMASRPLPIALCARSPENPGAGRTVDRRGFLRHLLGQSASAIRPDTAPETIGEPPRPNGRARILPAERVARIATLSRIGMRTRRSLPASLFQSARVSDSCCNHQVCANVCPVAALELRQTDTWSGIAFNAALCIGCGACERRCPEEALHIAAPAANGPGNGIFVLTRHDTQTCFDCGTSFVTREETAGDSPPICPACRKSQELGQSLFAGLFQRT
jgi:ferredoxin